LLAGDRPALLFPNMNDSMWLKKSTQRHVATLRADGHTVIEPQRRPVFTLWKRENEIGLTMPPPEEATEIIALWLEASLDPAAESDLQSPPVPAPSPAG
jgi:phosphopantothenoylcysteine synthetase/decarboxylase